MDNQTMTENLENTKTTEEVTPESFKDGDVAVLDGVRIEVKNSAPDDVILSVDTSKFSIQQDPDKLLKALYWIWDGFGRTAMPMFLVHQTAKDALANHDLKGDKVEVGVRRNEWLSNRNILDIFTQPLFEDENKAQYEFEGVPVIVHIYDDDESIINLDHKLYRHETFKFPNPYNRFEELYG